MADQGAELERTHLREHELAEISSRELLEERQKHTTEQFRALREWAEVRFDALEKLAREHRADDQRALEQALVSAKDAIAADRAATQEAIKKSEQAQKETNQATYVAQEQRRVDIQMLRTEMMPRLESDTKFDNLIQRLSSIEMRLAQQEGVKLEATASRSEHQVNTGQVIAAIVGLAVVIGTILAVMARVGR